MSQLKQIKLFIIITLIIISIPLVFLILGIQVTPESKFEKKISLNFKRNFPLKKDLIKIYSNFKTSIGSHAIPEKAVDLHNGWKFLGNSYSNVLSESLGIIRFTDKELKTLKRNLIKRKQFLESNGIKFYLAIAPNKHSIYGNIIPITKSKKTTKFQQLDSLCKVIDVNFINLGSKFPDPKDTQLYFKTDTHWNYIGGYYGFSAILDVIKADFKEYNFKEFDLEKDFVKETKKGAIGDLNTMLKLPLDEDCVYLHFKDSFKSKEKPKILQIRPGYHNPPEQYENRYESDVNTIKIMTYNDSFFAYMSSYFRETFGECIFMWDIKLNMDLILSEKPDIFLHEIVERDIDQLLE